MKLNLDCCRDVLFFLEDNLTITDDFETESVSIHDVISALDKYKPGELANTLLVLEEAGFIISDDFHSDDSIEDIIIDRITYNGYQFIESVRPETVWNKVKNIGLKIGSFSIDTASQIAVGVITALINAQLGL
ncbi:MAG: DUF2513 domain-containing protein [Ruminococcus sp.]|nr:DUF2513 domain-containing protein [Ruminococcus sp.]